MQFYLKEVISVGLLSGIYVVAGLLLLRVAVVAISGQLSCVVVTCNSFYPAPAASCCNNCYQKAVLHCCRSCCQPADECCCISCYPVVTPPPSRPVRSFDQLFDKQSALHFCSYKYIRSIKYVYSCIRCFPKIIFSAETIQSKR